MDTENSPSKDSSFSDYSIDYLLAESDNSFYATIYDLTDEPLWIPKSVVDDYWRFKHWFIRQIKEGKRNWKKEEKKELQTKLTFLLEKFQDKSEYFIISPELKSSRDNLILLN